MKASAVVGELDRAVERPDSTFERSLRREVLFSERRRMFRVVGVLVGVLALIVLLRAIAPGVVEAIVQGRLSSGTPLAIFLPFIAYELLDTPGSASIRARRWSAISVRPSG